MNIKALFTKPNIFGTPASAMYAPPPPPLNPPKHRLTTSLLCLLLSLASGGASAQTSGIPAAQDTSIDVGVASDRYLFQLNDFAFKDADGNAVNRSNFLVEIITVPDRGRLVRRNGTIIRSNEATSSAPSGDFTANSSQNLFWIPPPEAISITPGFTSFTYRGYSLSDTTTISSHGTVTINLVLGETTQRAAGGAPEVTGGMGASYATNAPLTASIYGVEDQNGIDTSTLAWQWQQADIPSSGTSAVSDNAYSDIAGTATTGGLTSRFTPRAAHVGKYIRVCASFKDQHATPASEERCNLGAPVVNAPSFGDASVAEQFWITGTAITNLVLPESSGGNGTITYSLSPATLPTGITFTAATRTLSGTPTAAKAAATYTYTATDTDGDTDTLRFSIAAGANAVPAFAANTAIADQAWMAGTAITPLSLPAATGGNGTLRYTISPALPAGLTFDPATRTISGTPTAAAQGDYTWTVTDADNNTATSDAASLTFSITVTGAPVAEDATYTATRTEGSNTVTIPASVFTGAYTDPDNDGLASVTITTLPTGGTLMIGEGTAATAVTANQSLAITDGEFDDGPLTFTITAEDLQSTTLMFTLSDGQSSSNQATLTISLSFGRDLPEAQVAHASAPLSAAAAANAADAIIAAIDATAGGFDISLDGTSLRGLAQTLHQSTATEQSPWYHSTTAGWEYDAAYNAGDDSAGSLLHRLQSMAAGDIAMNWQAGDSGMRYWGRYQSLDISGNEGETLEYDGSGTGFYIGADRRINERLRVGLAISTDSADIALDMDGDGTADDATRSATTIHPYLHTDLGDGNYLRVIAGFGSGTLDIKSTANSNSTASAALSWNMLAASISHHRPMRGKLSARFDGSLQLGYTSVDAATFTNGSNLEAADSSIGEMSINAQLRRRGDRITPYASLAARKMMGDLSQSLAMDLGLGADLQTGAAILRLAITRQLNDTTHKRDSLSLDLATNPNPSGITASLGSRYDSITGRPQWHSRLGWQYRNFQTSLQASPDDWRLQARVRW